MHGDIFFQTFAADGFAVERYKDGLHKPIYRSTLKIRTKGTYWLWYFLYPLNVASNFLSLCYQRAVARFYSSTSANKKRLHHSPKLRTNGSVRL